ncbi:MAG: hypothetical protein ACR2OJ_13940 [Hyphomicrobiales bacterium]
MAGSYIENLTLTGNANLNGTGNLLNNIIMGNAGDNIIIGEGGDDVLTGGGGEDLFIFDIGSGEDTILDYIIGEDAFDISSLIAAGLEFGPEDVTQINATDALVDLGGGNTVTVVNVNATQLYDDMAEYNAVV